jgi:hypothetical protein
MRKAANRKGVAAFHFMIMIIYSVSYFGLSSAAADAFVFRIISN